MSEKKSINNEANQESVKTTDEQQPIKLEQEQIDLGSVEQAQANQLEAARNAIETETIYKEHTLEKFKADKLEAEDNYQPPANKELKKIGLNQELKHIRQQLSKPDKLVSRLIHQPAVRLISETSSKTITRPSGLLGGGITAFAGTSLYYYFTKHIGVRYNYLIFLMLFVVGFGLGLCVELTVWAVRSKKKVF